MNNLVKYNRANELGPDLNFAKIPPQAVPLEEVVLGAILLERGAFDEATEILSPEFFYKNAHRKIFEAMLRLNNKSQPIDILTVSEELRSHEELETTGGPFYLTQLTNQVVSSANIASHCRIMLQKFLQREVIRIGAMMQKLGYEDATDAFDLLDEAQEELSSLGVKYLHGDMVGIDTALVETIQQIQVWRKEDSSITGVPSGYSRLDTVTRGWQDGDLIIIAARPSVGKSAFALNICINAAKKFIEKAEKNKTKPKAVGFWSLEMRRLHLVLRMLAKESKIMLYKIQTGAMSEDDMKKLYKEGIQMLANKKIFFDDRSGLTLQKLRAKSRRLKKKEQLGLIIVDYIQLMSGDGKGNREQEISNISRGLKGLAQELEVPVIALSALSREVEKRTGAKAKPQLSDLRESGAIEQDADMVIFLWGPTEEEIQENIGVKGRRFLRVAKQRNGTLTTLEFDFHDDIQFFEQTGLGAYLIPFERASNPDQFHEPLKVTTGSKFNGEDDIPKMPDGSPAF